MRDALAHSTVTVYDDASNKKTVTPEDTHSVQFPQYDEMNRLQEQIDERNFTSSRRYDHAGNLTWQKDENDKVYSYTYDLLNRKTSMTYPRDDALYVAKELWSYDAAGNLHTFTNRNGSVQTFTYDERNRQIRFSWNDGITPWQETDYDDASRVTEIRTGVANSATIETTIHHAYYDDNRLKTEEEWSSLSGNVHRTVTYTYDDDGNRQTLTYPGGSSFKYSYTERNQLMSIESTGSRTTPSGAGDLEVMLVDDTQPSSGQVVSYLYDKSGNLTSILRDNGTSTVVTPRQR